MVPNHIILTFYSTTSPDWPAGVKNARSGSSGRGVVEEDFALEGPGGRMRVEGLGKGRGLGLEGEG